MNESWLGTVKRLVARRGSQRPDQPGSHEADNPGPRADDLNRGFRADTTPRSGVGTEGHWNPFVERRRESVERPTYRARRRHETDELPRWDPYDEAWSRERRIRQARHAARRPPTGQDYYAVLGVSRGASDDEIERAYRRYVARTHPDRFYDDPVRRGLAEAKLKELNAIMQVLRDPVRRALYDARL